MLSYHDSLNYPKFLSKLSTYMLHLKVSSYMHLQVLRIENDQVSQLNLQD